MVSKVEAAPAVVVHHKATKYVMEKQIFWWSGMFLLLIAFLTPLWSQAVEIATKVDSSGHIVRDTEAIVVKQGIPAASQGLFFMCDGVTPCQTEIPPQKESPVVLWLTLGTVLTWIVQGMLCMYPNYKAAGLLFALASIALGITAVVLYVTEVVYIVYYQQYEIGRAHV